MSIVYQAPGNGPRMHALVIGCGRFPYMTNPAEAARQACYDSAVEIIRFLVEHCDRLMPPLGSIDCLLADPRVDPQNKDDELLLDMPGTALVSGPVDRPTQENVTVALNELAARCRPSDTLFLYFCSHGVAGRDETGLLVLEDVNRYAGNPWQQILDVKFLAQALPVRSAAAAVWMYLDACQEVIPELKDRLNGAKLTAPLDATATEISRCRVVSATLSAGRYGAKTHAPPGGGVAYFTRALIEGMTRCCVERREREWRVTAMRIMFGLEGVARAVDGTVIETSQLIPFNKEAQLLRVDQPSIPVHITSVPSSFIEGSVQAQLIDDTNQVVCTKGQNEEWRFRIGRIPSSYTVRLTYNGKQHDSHLEVEAPAVLFEVQQP